MSKSNLKIAAHFAALGLFLLTTLILQAQSAPVVRVPAPGVSPAKTVERVEELNKQQQYQISLDLLMEALNLHPDSTALRSSFKKTFALHIYQQVSGGYRRISANKHDVEAYVNVARTYGMIGDNFRAMEILTQGTLENPESVPLWMLIGYLELQEKREAEALSVFREIIRLDNKNGRAHHSAADLLVRAKDGRLHDLPSALHHAELACVLEPNNAEFIDTLAEVRFQMGNKREALALIQQAISLAPNDDSFKAQRARFEAK